MKSINTAIVILVCGLMLWSCEKNKSPEQQDITTSVYQKMINQGLLKDQDIESFLSNINASKELVEVDVSNSYDDSNDQTVTSYKISPKSGTVLHVTLIAFIEKEVANSVNDIVFNTPPTVILDEDPVIMWHVECLDGSRELVCTFNGKHVNTGTIFLLTENEYEYNIARDIYGATASDNGAYDHHSAGLLTADYTIDQDEDTYWAGLQSVANQEMTITFDKPYTIHKVMITEVDNAYMTAASLSYYNGVEWLGLDTSVFFKSSPNHVASFTPVHAYKIKLSIASSDTPSSWINKVSCIRSVRVYSTN